MMMTPIILEKIMFGITLAAPIGPVSIEMLLRGANKGFWAAFEIRLGGVIGNAFCLILALFGVLQLLDSPLVMDLLVVLGSLLLFYMGYQGFYKEINVAGAQISETNGLLLGCYLAIVNPIALVIWPSCIASSPNAPLWTNFFVLVGVLIWGALFSLVVHIARHSVSERVLKNINKIGSLALILYGMKKLLPFIKKTVFV